MTYAVTCKHVFGDFSPSELAIQSRLGDHQPIGISRLFGTSNPMDDAVDSDIQDLQVLQVSESVDHDWFKDSPVKLAKSELFYICQGDRLRAVGFPKDKLILNKEGIETARTELQMEYLGTPNNDKLLHKARLPQIGPEVGSVVGFSGGAVFHEASGSFCGIIIRGNVTPSGDVIIWFIDAHDVREAIKATFNPGCIYRYKKTVRT